MTATIKSFISVGIICGLLAFYIEGEAEEKWIQSGSSDRWIHYGSSDNGDYYYDQSSVRIVGNRVVRVWRKFQPSKDENGFTVSLHELDCVNHTTTYLRVILYDDQGMFLKYLVLPNPETRQIVPGSLDDVLLTSACRK